MLIYLPVQDMKFFGGKEIDASEREICLGIIRPIYNWNPCQVSVSQSQHAYENEKTEESNNLAPYN